MQRRQIIADWVEDKLLDSNVRKFIRHWKWFALLFTTILVFFIMDLYHFVWLHDGVMYSQDSLCDLPLRIASLPQRGFVTLQDHHVRQINTCYLEKYNLKCIHPHVYGAKNDLTSWKTGSEIHHHSNLTLHDWTFDHFIPVMVQNSLYPQKGLRNATLAQSASSKTLSFSMFEAMCIHAMLRPAPFAAPFQP